MPATARIPRWRFAFILFFTISMFPMGQLAAQPATNSWVSPSFGFEVTWSDDWEMDDSLNLLVDGSFELITLWNSDDAYLMITAFPGDASSLTSMLAPADAATVLEDNRDAAVPSMLSEEAGSVTLVEGYVLNDIAISALLSATPEMFDATLASAQEGVAINGVPLLAGEPLGDVPTDLTTEPTEAVTGRTTRNANETPTATEATTGVTRTTRNANETPTVTAEPTTATTRTTRNANETPTPTEAAAPGSFTGPIYGYSLTYDPAIWTTEDTRDSGEADGIQLSTADGIVDIWAWNGYAADPVLCLSGEEAYFPENIDGISQWEQATDADGNPLRYEGDDLAWSVFTYVYQNSRGEDVPLVDYISCQPIPGQDAALIVHISALPESYNTVLDQTLDIAETIQFANAPVETPTAEATEAPTEAAADTDVATTVPVNTLGSQISTNVQGTAYTSPTWGFTMDVPLEWVIVEETATGGEETLVLNNGTSMVTVWATDATMGDLSACVDYAAAQSGLDLALDENAAGGAFRGEYGDEAFANFVYTDGGTEMMYFVSCREIPGTSAHLIVIQQVEYSQFTAQRRFRSQLESSIVFP